MGCFSGRLMSTANDQKLFCKLCSPFCCSFDEFVEEKVISPSYSSTILTPPINFIYKVFSFSKLKSPFGPVLIPLGAFPLKGYFPHFSETSPRNFYYIYFCDSINLCFICTCVLIYAFNR